METRDPNGDREGLLGDAKKQAILHNKQCHLTGSVRR
jgi:hypothetical protein